MSHVWTIARREFRGYFDHPTAYILIVAFLALGLFLTFRALYATGLADLRALFDYLPWLFAVFVPAITMRSLAEERGRGTMEWLMAQPLSEGELVLGKALGDWLFVLVALAGTIPTAVGLLIVSDAGWGTMVAQYVGGALLAFQLVGIGLFASAATKNQITAFILAAVINFALVLAGLQIVLVGLPPSISELVTRLAIPPHAASVSRGVIDLRDVLYFLTVGGLFLVIAYFLVVRLRLSRERGAYRRLQVGTAALAIGVVTLNLLGGEIRGRLDLTEDDLYTLSDGTRQMLGELDDLVTIRLFVSSELPPEVMLTRRDVEDLLADFERYSDGDVRVEVSDPGSDEEVAGEAQSYGIQPIQFNVLREDEFQVRRGWFGLAVLHAGEQEVIPFVERSDDLEYRLVSAIWSMTAERRPRLAFVTGFGARTPDQLPGLGETLNERYDVTSVDLAGDSLPDLSPDDIDVLGIVGPTETLSDGAVEAVRAYLDAGGSGLFLLERVLIDAQSPMTAAHQTGLEPVLEERGLRLRADLVADFRSNQTVNIGQQGPFSLLQSYPLWPILVPAGDHPVTRGLEVLTVAWASAIEVTDTERVTPLWMTTEFGDLIAAGGTIAPDGISEPSNPDALARRLVAAAAPSAVRSEARNGNEAGGGDASPAPSDGGGGDGGDAAPRAGDAGSAASGTVGAGTAEGRIVLVADGDLLAGQILQASPQNLTFVQNSVDWLAQDERLISIRSKDRTPAPLVFSSDLERAALRWGNLVGVPALFVLGGLLWSVRRRGEAQRLWEEVQA